MSIAYMLAITSTVVSFGRLADSWGAGRVLLAGLLVFAIGTALAAGAPLIRLLAAFRALQGLGAAMLLASGQALAVALHPGDVRARALAWLHVAVSAGYTAGPAVGGVLLELFSWRSIFLLTLPVALGTAGLAVRARLHESERRPGRVDLGQSAWLAAGLVLLLLGVDADPDLAQAGSGWRLPAIALAATLLAGFLLIQARAREPLFDLRLFHDRAFAAGLLAAFLAFIAMASNMFLVPFLLRDEMGMSAVSAGLVMITVPLTIISAAPWAGRLADQFGYRGPATAGLALVTVAVALMSLLQQSSLIQTAVVVLVLYGAGAALFQGPNNAAVLAALPTGSRGLGSGILVTARQLGQVLGIAVAAGIWASRLHTYEASKPTHALAISFHDAFLALAAFGAAATLISAARRLS